MEITKEEVLRIRKGIVYDELITEEQEKLLAFLNIDWEEIIEREGRIRGVALIQQKISGKLLHLNKIPKRLTPYHD